MNQIPGQTDTPAVSEGNGNDPDRRQAGADKPATDRTTQSGAPAKSIILFSDGTGNSSAKLFKTNVWRMYEAVDLGPPAEDNRKQIAYYDNGVGTSGFKLFAILGGIFGIGLRRNVLDIYRYACRNYSPARGQRLGEVDVEGGDHIYGFGFSRGAFTMRVAVAMIAKLGLVVTDNEADLDRRASEAWKIFRSYYRPRSDLAPANLWRRFVIRNARADKARARALHKERSRNFHPVIRFVGVWDTVAAYGGPVSEIVQAIDNWFVRLSMPNYALADSVRRARHALALDDERDAFHPLLWDEIHEEEAIKAAKAGLKPKWIDEHRLEQVWFTGMHADVGGGYPDESLSYVSFLWMLEEAEEAGLRSVPLIVARFRALTSSAGPIHNSRAGPASYYRYQPRRIEAYFEPLDQSLLTRRHPDRKRGLIRLAKIHESVAARIASGTDRYAPLSLPAEIRVVPPQRAGENAPQQAGEGVEGNAGCVLKPPPGPPLPLIPRELRERFENEALNRARIAGMSAVWAQVGKRRFLYITSLLLTLLLFLMPLWADKLAPAAVVLASGHGLVGQLIGLLAAILPGFLSGLVETWAEHPLFLLTLVGILVVTNLLAGRIERSLRDDTRKLWDQALGLTKPLYEARPAPALPDAVAVDGPESPAPTAWQKIRRTFRWKFIPVLLLALMIALALWGAALVVARVSLFVFERRDGACASSAPLGNRTEATFHFATGATCTGAGLVVEKGQRYAIEMNVAEVWKDGAHITDPRGLTARDLGFWGYFAALMRRAAGANYLQPVAHIYGNGGTGPVLQPLMLQQRSTPPQNWRGEFVARSSGPLSIFANDVAPLFDRYGNNKGTATVTVRWIGGPPSRTGKGER